MAPAAGLAGLAILLLLIALRMPIGLALGVVGIGGTWALLGWDTLVFALGSAPVEAMSNFTLSVLPLFIFMGILAVKAGFAESLYKAAYAFVGHRRDGLAIASIVACGGFGAVSGSSLATVAAMGKFAVPEKLRYGYSRPLAAGSVATAGTVAILIPPSLPMIIYALLTEVSIGKLFAAGILPGILAVLLYALTTVAWMRVRPQDGPAGERVPWANRLRALAGVWGVVSIFLLVLGGIFGGLFSPTEGASVGAAGALLLGVLSGKIGWPVFVDAVSETVVLTAAILFVVIGVSLFSFFVTGAHFPQFLSAFIGGLDLSKISRPGHRRSAADRAQLLSRRDRHRLRDHARAVPDHARSGLPPCVVRHRHHDGRGIRRGDAADRDEHLRAREAAAAGDSGPGIHGHRALSDRRHPAPVPDRRLPDRRAVAAGSVLRMTGGPQRLLAGIAALAGVAIVCLMTLTVLDIAGRNLRLYYLVGVIEISTLTMVLMAYFAFSHTFVEDGHIAVDLFTTSLSNRTNARLDAVLAGRGRPVLCRAGLAGAQARAGAARSRRAHHQHGVVASRLRRPVIRWNRRDSGDLYGPGHSPIDPGDTGWIARAVVSLMSSMTKLVGMSEFGILAIGRLQNRS